MSGSVFHVAKGRGNELHDRVAIGDYGGSALVVVLLQGIESETALLQHESLASILDAPGNIEANFTNYSRVLFPGYELTPSAVDQTRRYSTIPNPVWLSAGGASNNTLTHLLVCYAYDAADADDAITPVALIPFAATTDGNDLTAFMDPSGYFEAY